MHVSPILQLTTPFNVLFTYVPSDISLPLVQLGVIPPLGRAVDPLALVLPPERRLEALGLAVLGVLVLDLAAARLELLLGQARARRRVRLQLRRRGVALGQARRHGRRVARRPEVQGREGDAYESDDSEGTFLLELLGTRKWGVLIRVASVNTRGIMDSKQE